jgi:hypothetical protein
MQLSYRACEVAEVRRFSLLGPAGRRGLRTLRLLVDVGQEPESVGTMFGGRHGRLTGSNGGPIFSRRHKGSRSSHFTL